MAYQEINDGESGLVVRTKLNEQFTELYASVELVDTAVAYVESTGSDGTGILGRSDKPFLTITGALNALPANGGVIRIGIGDFDAPADDFAGGSVLKNNVRYVGTKMPWIDSTYTVNTFPVAPSISAPTKLENGTVIKGRIYHEGRYNIVFENLGVDVGSAFCTLTGGDYASGQNCIAFSDPGSGGGAAPTTVSRGIIIRNVICLGQSATSNYHCCAIESSTAPLVENLWTFYNTWGFAAKTQGGIFKNIFCFGHTSGSILKSDIYAPSQKNILDGFQMRPIAGVGGGFTVESNTANMNGNIVTNGLITECSFGFKAIATAAMSGNSFNNITAWANSGVGFQFQGLLWSYNEVVNPKAIANTGVGININLSINNFLILKNPYCHGNGSHGIQVSASDRVYAENIYCAANTGYGISNAGTVYRYTRLYTGNTLGGENGGTFVDSNSSTQI